MYKARRVPEGRMIRGEREIALTTLVSLTAFQPSLWDGSSLSRFQPRKAFGAGYDHRSLRDKIRRAPRLRSCLRFALPILGNYNAAHTTLVR